MYFALYAWNSDVLRRLGRLGRRFFKHIKNKLKQVKTKKFTTLKEVWIPGLRYHRFSNLIILLLHLLFSFCFDWEDITGDSVSLAIQTPQFSSKILSVICLTHFSVMNDFSSGEEEKKNIHDLQRMIEINLDWHAESHISFKMLQIFIKLLAIMC